MITTSPDRQTDLFCSKNVHDLALMQWYNVNRHAKTIDGKDNRVDGRLRKSAALPL